jgi:DNA-3-methyladenine glycosylase II
MTPHYWAQATRALKRRDPVMGKLIRTYRSAGLRTRGDAFGTLARSIVGQQISVKAADSVWRKLEARAGEITAASICRLANGAFRECGVSARKAQYLADLAQQFVCGPFGRADCFELEDEALIRELTRVKGIGRWTAEMFLIFYLTRPNVFPIDDLGLRRAIYLHYNDGAPLCKAEIEALGASWLPWRSVATWYLWRSLDPVPVEY